MYNPNVYDKSYLMATLGCLEGEINDLEKWSVYNNDKGNEELSLLRKAFELVKNNLKKGE